MADVSLLSVLFVTLLSFLQIFSQEIRNGISSETLHLAPHLRSIDNYPKPFLIKSDLEDQFVRAKQRSKRSAESHQPNIDIFSLNDSHSQLLVHWAGKGSDVVICLAYDRQQDENSTSQVFISYDYGKSFTERQKELMTISQTKPSVINMFYISPVLNSHFVFTDVINKYVFTTFDFGRTFKKVQLLFKPEILALHPTNHKIILAMDKDDPMKRLFLSEDFGATWNPVESHVKSFFWGKDKLYPPNTLFVERQEPGHTSTVIRTTDFFKNRENNVVVVADIEDFEAHDKYLFATKRQQLLGSHNRNGTLQLWVSYDGRPFQNALFPSHLERKDFYIADASEDQVFVCVMHDDFTANLYISDIRGATFSLSLERIFYISPAVRGGILESDKELIDFHKVQGLRGVYIATQLKGHSLQSSPLDNMVSVITFDKGGKWQNLTAPKVDKDGNLFNCKESEGCSLHVSQKFSQLYSRTRIPPILSRESAVGIVVASGVLGKSLKGHPSVFVSSDAGLSWHHVLFGSYLYNFGDFGSVILAVQYYSQGGETDLVLYSLDDGETWMPLKLFNDEHMSIRIYGLMTEPGEKTTTFTLFGSRPDRHQWVLIKIDLRDVFPYNCQPDDYKFWSPHGPNKTCLLGRMEVYQRRIPRTRCYNGQDYERPVRTENCPCSIDDFECDFGFKEDLYSGHCIRDGDSGTDPYAIPYICKPGAFYNRTKGYRKISGDACEGGEDFRYGPESISCPVSEEAEFLIVTERHKISRIALNTEGKAWEDLPLPNLKNPVAVEYDYHNNCIYWADYDDGEVARLRLDGKSEVEVIYHSKDSTLEGLALDWISRNLYLVDGMKHLVKMLYVNSTFPIHFQRTILNESHVDKPRGIAVHPTRGYLFITDWSDTNPRIARTFLDGSNFVILFDSSVVSWPNGITIDYQGERIFWVDARKDYIASSDFDGRNLKMVLEGGSVPHVFGVAVYKDWIYFGDWDKRGIFVANKYDGSGLFTLAPTTNQPMDLKVFAHGMQQGNNMCNNASISPCSHLCSIHPHNQRVCLCPNGADIQKLNNENEKCFCPGNILMLSNGSCPSVSSTCSHEQFHCSNDICIPNTWKCDGDNDCLDSSDETNCDVKVCNSNQFSCHSGHCIPKAWHCDFDNDCIDGSDELNCNYPPCTAEKFQCQNGRCINKNYRCDFDDDCKDGSDEVNCTLPSAFCRHNEFSCRNSKQCLPGTWKCDGERDCKDGSDEENCTISTCEQWQHRCNNGHCIFKSWLCDGEDDCEDNSDEQNCSHTTATPLSSSTPSDTSCYFSFKCMNGKCIPLEWTCDKVDDCGDNSDELMCDNTTLTTTTTSKPTTSRKPEHCGEDRYRCNSGLCIWNSWVCDGTKDCESGEDEKNCQPGAVCPLGQFRCVHSGGCIEPTDLCNGKHDCGDGSDEWGCRNDTVVETTIHPHCPPDKHFQCKIIGECIDIVNLCNQREDCIDGSDEWNCSHEQNYYLVKNLMVDSKTITPTNFTVIWEPPILEKNLTFKYRPSISESDSTNWKNQKLIMTTNFTFTGLLPGKKYKVRIDACLKNQSHFTPSDYYIYIVTENKAPSAPTNLAVEQRGQTVFVKWSSPLNYSGAIFGYKIYISPPTPPHVEKVNQGNTTHILFNSSIFIPGVNYTFWATAFSDSLESINSELVYLLYDKNFTLSSVSGLNISAVTNSSVRISWKKITEKNSGYCVLYRPKYEDVTLPWKRINTTETSIKLISLSPGTLYVFEVFAYTNETAGPAEHTEIVTNGNPLSIIPGIKSIVNGTTVILQWDAPNDKRTDKWLYGVYTLKPYLNIRVLIGNTTDTNFTISGLSACEVFRYEVRLIGPFGIGPSKGLNYTKTEFDTLAPPKNLAVKSISHKRDAVTISWDSSCLKLDEKIGYEIVIHDSITNKTEKKYVKPSSDTHLSVNASIHFGAKYMIKVRTYNKGSQFTDEILYIAPKIPVPQQVKVVLEKNGSIFIDWKEPEMPPELSNHSYTYSIWVSEEKNINKALHYTVSSPPIVIPPVADGKIYHLAVSITEQDGYQSELSDWNDFANPSDSQKIVVSVNNLVSIVVPVVIVILALIFAVGFFAIRHRRLQRSFLSFANSHYEASVSATFSNSEGLDEEDSPMIRGFSDDEPLIVA